MDKKYLLRENASFEYQKDDEDLLAALNDKSRPLILTGVIQRYDTLNKNGRVYSKDILMQEVRNYDEMFVKTDSAWGELDHCLTEEHQIHTTSGWKYLKDIAEDEEIYTLNTKTGIIEKETILRKIAKPYTGEMYRFYANKHKDLLNCTPNHKMIFWNRYGKYKEMFAKEVYEKLEAGSRELGKSRMKIGGTWIGESPDTFTILFISWKVRFHYTILFTLSLNKDILHSFLCLGLEDSIVHSTNHLVRDLLEALRGARSYCFEER
jgi:hypothetical protein